MILMQKLYYTVAVSRNRQLLPIDPKMWLALLVGALAGTMLWAEDTSIPPMPKQPGLAESIAQQRAAVLRQVAAVMGKAVSPPPSFFTAPWVETPMPVSTPPACDPMPKVDLDKIVEQNSQQQGVRAELIRAVIAEESGARPCAVSGKGAQGIMQLMPATSEQFGVKDPFDAKQNVEAGTKLLKQLLTKYNDNVSLALAAYNAGEGRVDKDGGVPKIPETQHYVTDIQSRIPQR